MARQKLTYVSNDTTWENIASTLGGIAGNIGNSMIKKHNAIQQADFTFIENTAKKLGDDYIKSAFEDDNYEEYQDRLDKFKDGFSDALKKATGKDKAVDSWLKKNGNEYWSSFDYSYNNAESNSLEAMNARNVNREIEYYSSTDGATCEGALEKANSVYQPDLDEYGLSNPNNPDTRISIAGQVFSSSMKYKAEQNFNGGLSISLDDGTEAQRFLSESEFEEYLKNEYMKSIDFVMQGFDEEYESNPSNPDKESTRAYLESLWDYKYKAIAREEYITRSKEHLDNVKDKARSVNNAIAKAKIDGTPLSWEEELTMYEEAGIDVENDEIAYDYISGIILGDKDEYEAGMKERANEIASFVYGDKDEIVDLISTGNPEYVSSDSYQIYSATGTETVSADGIDNGVQMYLDSSFIASKGGDDARIATMFGGAVEQFCEKYDITDPKEKMMVASKLNSLVPSGIGMNATSTGNSPAMSILNSMLADPLSYDKDTRQAIADSLKVQGFISDQEWQEFTDNNKDNNSIADVKYDGFADILKQAATDYGLYENNEIKQTIAYNKALESNMKQFLKSNPEATYEQMYAQAEKYVAQFANEDLNKDIWKALKDLISDASDGSFTITNKILNDIIADYNAGNNFFLTERPDAIANIKTAILRGTFDNKEDLIEYCTKVLYKEADSIEDLTDIQKNTVYDAMVVAFYETKQYQEVEQAAKAMAGEENCREVRFLDQTIGIMDKNGVVYKSNGDYNNMMIGKIDKSSGTYKMVFSESYLNHGIYNPRASDMINPSDVKGWTEYQANFTTTGVEPEVAQELQAEIDNSNLVMTEEEKEEIFAGSKRQKNRRKTRSEITDDDFRNDWSLVVLYDDLIKGNYNANI